MKKWRIIGLIGAFSGTCIMLSGLFLLDSALPLIPRGLFAGGLALLVSSAVYASKEKRKEREAKTWCRFCGSEVKNGGDPVCGECRRIIANISE